MGKHCQQIDLTINQDWDSVINLLTAKAQEIKTTVQGQSQVFQVARELNNTRVVSHSLDSWDMIHGSILNTALPWLKELLSTVQDLSPSGYWIGIMDGSVQGHIDGHPKIKSALNYIIESDSNSFTWVMNEKYPSLPGTAWILDTTKYHGVTNKGLRYTFSIRLNTPYADVKAWADKQGPMVFGS